jgi:type III secretion protein L
MAKIIKAARPPAGETGLPPTAGRAEARALLDAAEHEAELIVAEARETGYAAGTASVEGVVAQVGRFVDDLRKRTDHQLQSGTRELVEGLMAAKVSDDDGFFAMVRHALRTLRRGRDIFLRVHPSRAPGLQARRDPLVAVLGRARAIEIREDITLPENGCVVETDAGVLDVGLMTQLGALFEGVR